MKFANRILQSEENLVGLRDNLKKRGAKAVFTAGGFDLIHVGHARYLSEAKTKGDVLIVGLTSNKAIQALKGPHKPVLDEKVRAEMLLYLKGIDYVVILQEENCQKALELLQPEVFITVGESWNKGCFDCPEAKIVQKHGGKVELVSRQSPKISTTNIINNIVGKQIMQNFKEVLSNSNGILKE